MKLWNSTIIWITLSKYTLGHLNIKCLFFKIKDRNICILNKKKNFCLFFILKNYSLSGVSMDIFVRFPLSLSFADLIISSTIRDIFLSKLYNRTRNHHFILTDPNLWCAMQFNLRICRNLYFHKNFECMFLSIDVNIFLYR